MTTIHNMPLPTVPRKSRKRDRKWEGDQACGLRGQTFRTLHALLRIWLPCKQISCAYCEPRLREKKLRHILACLAGALAFTTLIADDTWDPLRERLRRARRNYFRIPVAPNLSILITLAPLDATSAKLDISQLDGIVLMAHQYAQSTERAIPRFSTSAAWVLKPNKNSKLVYLGQISRHVFHAIAQRYGSTPRYISLTGVHEAEQAMIYDPGALDAAEQDVRDHIEARRAA